MPSMEESLKYFLERTTPLGRLARIHRQRRLRKKFHQWEADGATGPMPNFGKQQVVVEYIKKYCPAVFVETGTYKGKMVYAVMPHVKNVYSIELDRTHYENARRRFAGYRHIHIVHGQSGEVLADLLKGINERCLFWLDAHWSGGSTAKGDLETPIMQEIECILHHPLAAEHVVLIDDARCFTGQNDYPALETLKSVVLSAQPDWVFETKNDIIRAHPDRLETREMCLDEERDSPYAS